MNGTIRMSKLDLSWMNGVGCLCKVHSSERAIDALQRFSSALQVYARLLDPDLGLPSVSEAMDWARILIVTSNRAKEIYNQPCVAFTVPSTLALPGILLQRASATAAALDGAGAALAWVVASAVDLGGSPDSLHLPVAIPSCVISPAALQVALGDVPPHRAYSGGTWGVAPNGDLRLGNLGPCPLCGAASPHTHVLWALALAELEDVVDELSSLVPKEHLEGLLRRLVPRAFRGL